MAKEIHNWNIVDVESFFDDRLRLAGVLFEACSNLLRQLINGPAKRHLNAKEYRSLRTDAHRFSLWGDGIGAKHGALDKILADSKHLKDTVIYFLNACWTCLTSLASRFQTSLPLPKLSKEIKILQEQVKSATAKAQMSTDSVKKDANQATVNEIDTVVSLIESVGMSDSESSSISGGDEETVEDLKSYIDCLLDLAPALENPAKNLTTKDKIHRLSEVNIMRAESRLFLAEIISRWPSMNERFAQRLAEANWKRREKLKAKLVHSQLPDVGEEVEDHGPILSAGPSSPTPRSPTTKSDLDRNARSESSLATGFGDEEAVFIRRGIPKLPEDHEWGATFKCIVCGDVLRNVDNAACWRKHVLDDLQPYICTYPECANGINTFASQRAWVNHEFNIHRVVMNWTCPYCPGEIFETAVLGLEHLRRIHKGADHEDLDVNEFEDFIYATSRRRIKSQPAEKQECPFCRTVVANTIKKFGAHVGQHFREIALTAIPVPTVIEPGVDFETYGSEDSGADETGNKSNELPVDGISNSESLPGVPLDMITPSLKTVKAEFISRDQHCVGTTTLHRRCRWSIPRARVHTFLDTLREVQESQRIELGDLEKLARYALCTRWHQYQDTRIAKEWLKEITKLDTERKGANS